MPLPLTLTTPALHQIDRAFGCEWLETNGLGGWASGTASGAHTRRYHGLLVAALRPPVGRMMLLSKIDETLLCQGATYELGCNQYPGSISPLGYQLIESFSILPFPTWQYHAGPIRFTKQIAALRGENTTVVTYTVAAAPGPVELLLRPFIAVRDYHALQHANDSISRAADFSDDTLTLRAYEGTPPFYLHVPGASFDHAPFWYYRFQYRQEQARGLDFEEDLFTHGVLRVTLAPGASLSVMVSIDSPIGRSPIALVAAEALRRENVVATAGFSGALECQLVRAADQFIVRRGADLHTVIAGYHWFSDWGRDTMISLPGLCLATKRFAEARDILAAFAGSASQGMLPNRFPDAGEQPEYNTVDATLWFFVAVRAYLLATGDEPFVRDKLLPVLEDILRWHDKGTRFHIHCDEDGLLFAGEPGVQLTWMDAKVGDWVVTPRTGKPVEINALWYNALAILAELRTKFNCPGIEALQTRAAAVKKRFAEVYWNESAGCLFDVIHNGDKDPSIRPNQLFAVSLPFDLLPESLALRVLKVVEQKLLTPVGLRSLAPGSAGYRPHYEGGVHSRDGAYHQGTVWLWLLGPYITALVRLRGEAGRTQARYLVDRLALHFDQYALGTLGEVFDAEPPFTPRGCIAQAWSIAEILRACRDDLGG
jgi:predicted glycogen debranching enzyme